MADVQDEAVDTTEQTKSPVDLGLPGGPPVEGQQPPPVAAPSAAANPAASLPRGPQQMAQFQDVMKRPDVLAAMARGYLKAGSGIGMQYLAMAHQAAHENMYQALGYLQNGDTEGAKQAFNSSGMYKVDNITKNDDGTFTATRDGQPDINFNVDTLSRSLLSPQEFQHMKYESARAEAAEKMATAAQARAEAFDKWYTGRNETAINVAQIKADQERRDAIWAAKVQIAKRAGSKQIDEFDQKYGPYAQIEAGTNAYRTRISNGGAMPTGADGKPLSPGDAALADVIGNGQGALSPRVSDDGKSVILVNNATGKQHGTPMDVNEFTRITGKAPPPAAPGSTPPPAPGAPKAAAPGAPPPPATPAAPYASGLPMASVKSMQNLDDDQLTSIANDPDPKHGSPASRAAAKSILQSRAKEREQRGNAPPPATTF